MDAWYDYVTKTALSWGVSFAANQLTSPIESAFSAPEFVQAELPVIPTSPAAPSGGGGGGSQPAAAAVQQQYSTVSISSGIVSGSTGYSAPVYSGLGGSGHSSVQAGGMLL